MPLPGLARLALHHRREPDGGRRRAGAVRPSRCSPGLLRDKAVFVTGGGRGIGRGIAEALAEAGAHVGLGDLRLEDAAETGALVESRGRRALAVALDVTQEASLDAAVDGDGRRLSAGSTAG